MNEKKLMMLGRTTGEGGRRKRIEPTALRTMRQRKEDDDDDPLLRKD